mgnify:CR=1 FL=1
MIVYTVVGQGQYVDLADGLKLKKEDKWSIYVNLTNRCTCSCTFCLRSMKKMAENETLWLKKEPTVDEVKAELDAAPWDHINEVVFCGFGEPTMRLDVLLELLRYVKQHHPELPTRLNTNGLGELENGREFASEFQGILDTVSISLNASNAERYFELTRAKFGVQSYDAMLTFAQHCKPYVPNVVLTIVDHVEGPEEIEKCRKICEERGLTLRVRPYEDS